MKIISGPARALHHYTRTDRMARNVASRFMLGHLEPDAFWKDFTQQRVNDLVSPPQPRRSLEPGNITTMVDPMRNDLKKIAPSLLKTVGVERYNKRLTEAQTLLCLGAIFHDDLHGWSDSLFLNWYLAGPARDFVVVGIGRVTIKPGDVMLFDPSRAHGLLRPGEKTIKEDEWSDDPKDHSIFLAMDIELTPKLEQQFGIKRKAHSTFTKNGSTDMNWNEVRVDPVTGRLRKAPAKEYNF